MLNISAGFWYKSVGKQRNCFHPSVDAITAESFCDDTCIRRCYMGWPRQHLHSFFIWKIKKMKVGIEIAKKFRLSVRLSVSILFSQSKLLKLRTIVQRQKILHITISSHSKFQKEIRIRSIFKKLSTMQNFPIQIAKTIHFSILYLGCCHSKIFKKIWVFKIERAKINTYFIIKFKRHHVITFF